MCNHDSHKDRLEMNLGIIAASIATIRPLFANLGPSGRGSSDLLGAPYASNGPFVKISKASKAGRKLTDILLNPTGTTKTPDAEMSQDLQEVSEERR